MRSLGKGPEMVEAIEGCVDAAVREWDEREQKRLLKVSDSTGARRGKTLPSVVIRPYFGFCLTLCEH